MHATVAGCRLHRCCYATLGLVRPDKVWKDKLSRLKARDGKARRDKVSRVRQSERERDRPGSTRTEIK